MALVATSGIPHLGDVYPYVASSELMDANGEKIGFIFQAPKAGNLGKIKFRTGVVTTGDTLKVSFQDVDLTTGYPDETVDQYRAIAINDADDNVYKTTGLITSDGADTGTKRTVTAGEFVACVFEFDAYVAGNLNINVVQQSPALIGGGYYARKTSGSWTKSANYVMSNIVVYYDDDSVAYMPTVLPAAVPGSLAVNIGSTPDEVGLYFQLPFPCKTSGCWVYMDADGDLTVNLYDSDGATVIASVNIDKDVRIGTSAELYRLRFTGEVTLAANTWYRLVLTPSTATSISAKYYSVDVNADFGQSSGGINAYWTQRTDAGAWSQTTNRRPLMGLLISALSDGAGGVIVVEDD